MKSNKQLHPAPAVSGAKTTNKKGKSDQRRNRNITLAALTLALGTAVYLNWSFARQAPVAAAPAENGVVTDALQVNGNVENEPVVQTQGEQEQTPVFDPLETSGDATGEQSANKNYGEAQLVSVSKDSGKEFFEAARLARSKARDEALNDIEKALKSTGLSQQEKDALSASLAQQLGYVTAESDLETLIKAKGFADCVVMLTENSANVTVMTENDALTANEVTQIRDAVLSRCQNLRAQDITVVEVK